MTTPDPKPCDVRVLAERLRGNLTYMRSFGADEQTINESIQLSADMLDRLAYRGDDIQPRSADCKHSNEQSVTKPSQAPLTPYGIAVELVQSIREGRGDADNDFLLNEDDAAEEILARLGCDAQTDAAAQGECK